MNETKVLLTDEELDKVTGGIELDLMNFDNNNQEFKHSLKNTYSKDNPEVNISLNNPFNENLNITNNYEPLKYEDGLINK